MSIKVWRSGFVQQQIAAVNPLQTQFFTFEINTAPQNGSTLIRTLGDFEWRTVVQVTTTNELHAFGFGDATVYAGLWYDPTGTVAAGSVPDPLSDPTPHWVWRGWLYPKYEIDGPRNGAVSQIVTYQPKDSIESHAQRKSATTQTGKLWFTVTYDLPQTQTIPAGTAVGQGCFGLFQSLYEHP